MGVPLELLTALIASQLILWLTQLLDRTAQLRKPLSMPPVNRFEVTLPMLKLLPLKCHPFSNNGSEVFRKKPALPRLGVFFP